MKLVGNIDDKQTTIVVYVEESKIDFFSGFPCIIKIDNEYIKAEGLLMKENIGRGFNLTLKVKRGYTSKDVLEEAEIERKISKLN